MRERKTWEKKIGHKEPALSELFMSLLGQREQASGQQRDFSWERPADGDCR